MRDANWPTRVFSTVPTTEKRNKMFGFKKGSRFSLESLQEYSSGSIPRSTYETQASWFYEGGDRIFQQIKEPKVRDVKQITVIMEALAQYIENPENRDKERLAIALATVWKLGDIWKEWTKDGQVGPRK